MGVTTTSVPSRVGRQRQEQRRVGHRVLRAGDIVKINGAGGYFRIRYFRGDEVEVFGGTPNYSKIRTFTVDRIGRRPRNGASLRPDLTR